MGIDVCVCSLLHARVALLLQQGRLAKRCKYGQIFCMYTHRPADQYIAVSAHSEGWRVELAGICPLPYRQPGTMSREGRNAPLPRLATLLVQSTEGAKRFFPIESRSFTLQRPPAVSDGEEHQYRGKHGAILVTHYAISAGLSSCVMGGRGGQTTLLAPSTPPFAEEV